MTLRLLKKKPAAGISTKTTAAPSSDDLPLLSPSKSKVDLFSGDFDELLTQLRELDLKESATGRIGDPATFESDVLHSLRLQKEIEKTKPKTIKPVGQSTLLESAELSRDKQIEAIKSIPGALMFGAMPPRMKFKDDRLFEDTKRVLGMTLDTLGRVPEALKASVFPFEGKSRKESAAQAFLRPEHVPAGRLGGEIGKRLNPKLWIISGLLGAAGDIAAFEVGHGTAFKRLARGFKAARTAERMKAFEKELDDVTRKVVNAADEKGLYPKDWTFQDKMGRTKVQVREMITGSKDPLTIQNPALGDKIGAAPTTSKEFIDILIKKPLANKRGSIKLPGGDTPNPKDVKGAVQNFRSIIPKFKGTEEALRFGAQFKDNPAVLAALNQARKDALERALKLRNLENPTDEQMQQGMDTAVEAQLYREAIEGAEDARPSFLADIEADRVAAAQDETFGVFKKSKEVFGITDDFGEAGYILPDGVMLDFSKKNQVGNPGLRERDHREIGLVTGQGGTEGMLQFMDMGVVRVDHASGAIHISQPLTPAQRSMLGRFIASKRGEVFMDVQQGFKAPDPKNPHFTPSERKFSKVYDIGTSASRVLNDVDAFFDNPINEQKFKVDEPLTALKAEPEISHGSVQTKSQNVEEVSKAVQETRPRGSNIVKQRSKISQELKERGFVDLRGKPVSNANDAAEIAVAFRHPKVEQFQIIYVKEGEIVGHRVLSSGMPNFVDLGARELDKIASAANRLAADEVYFAHNHPSGNPLPSRQDVKFTQDVKHLLGEKMKGHTVIDDQEYTVISVDDVGDVTSKQYSFTQSLPKFFDPEAPVISNADLAASAVKDFMVNERATVMFMDSANRVLSVDNLGIHKDIKQYISDKMKDYKATSYIISYKKGQRPVIEGELPPGLLDTIRHDVDGLYQSWSEGDLVGFRGQKVFEETKLYGIQEERVPYDRQSLVDAVKRLGGIRLSGKGIESAWPEHIKKIPQDLINPDAKHDVWGMLQSLRKEGFDFSGLDYVEQFTNALAEPVKKVQSIADLESEDIARSFDRLPLEEQERLAEEALSEIEMADFMNSPENNLFTAIQQLGKIRPFKGGFMAEELKRIPAHLKSKDAGNTLDEIVGELESFGWRFDNADDLLEAIDALASASKSKGSHLKWIVRRFNKNRRMQENLRNKVTREIEKLLAKPVVTTKVKGIVRAVTGQFKVQDYVREDVAFKEILRKQAAAAREAFREGQLSGKEELYGLLRQRAEAEKLRKEVHGLMEDIRKIKTDKMDRKNKDAIESIQNSLDFTVPMQQTIHRLVGTLNYIISNPEAELPDYVIQNLERLTQMTRKDMTIDQLRSIHQVAKHHEHLANLKHQLFVKNKMRQQEEVLSEALAEMKPGKVIDKTIVESPEAQKLKIKNAKEYLVRLMGINQDHFDLIVEGIAGEDSISFDVLFAQVKEGIRKKLRFKQKITDMFGEQLENLPFKIKDIGKWRKEIVKTGRFRLTRGERMSIYLHMQNENNLRHLLQGGFTFAKDSGQVLHRISGAELNEIWNSITPQERTIASINSAVEEVVYKALNDVFKEKNGYELPKEENYFRIRIARKFLDREQEESSIIEQFRNKFVRIGLTKGFLNQRVRSKKPLILEDFFHAMADQLEKSASYIGLEIPLSNASKLLYDGSFRGQITIRYGPEVWHHIEKGLRDIAGDADMLTDFEQAFQIAKNRVTKNIFALNPGIAAKQILSYPLFGVYIDNKYLMRGMADYIADPKGVIERHKAFSPEFRDRLELGFNRDIADVFKAKSAAKLAGDKESFSEMLLGMIRFMDKNTVASGMQAAVLQELDKLSGTNLPPEEKLRKAYSFADYVVNRTQPTFALEHRSPMSRGRPLEKILTFATAATNQELNLLRRLWRKYQRTKNPEDMRKFTKAAFYAFVVIPLGNTIIDYWADVTYRKRYPPEKITAGYVAGKVISSQAALFYIVRDLVSSAISYIDSEGYFGYDVTNPVYSEVNNAVRTVGHGVNALYGGVQGTFEHRTSKERNKDIRHAKKFVDGLLELIAVWNGLPYTTPKKMLMAPFRDRKNISDEKSRRRRLQSKKKRLRLLNQ